MAPCVVFAAPAAAGTLTVEHGALVYTAAPGETNTVTVNPDNGVVQDQTATMSRGAGCEPSGSGPDEPHSMSCAGIRNLAPARLDLGDGNDSYSYPYYGF